MKWFDSIRKAITESIEEVKDSRKPDKVRVGEHIHAVILRGDGKKETRDSK